MSSDTFWNYFFEIYESIPRQGPGDRASTERALRLLPPLTADQRILDIGCGSGAQTIDLARATAAQIVAVDNHPPFIAKLARRADELGLSTRITAQVGDMGALPFGDGSFDVLWSEGAIFILGFSEGLAAWRRLLPPGGHLVVSEFCWFDREPAAELLEMFRGDCPEADHVDARRQAISDSGYRLLGDFVLPQTAWRDNYHGPLAQSLERFRSAHAGDPDALAEADRCQREIALYQRHPGAYGYVFFVMQREGDDG